MEGIAQPYSGTIFMEPDLITSSDPTTFQSASYTGRGYRTVFDRRSNSWVSIYAYLFNVQFSDGLSSEGIVNPEFGSVSNATSQINTYAWYIGQLPKVLRLDVDGIWIHQGTQPFGGGNNSILINTGQASSYLASGILEETLIHEAAHTSLDAYHANASGWVSARNSDGGYISTYAKNYPSSEDIAESFLPWMAVRHLSNRLSTSDKNTILSTISNRLNYFDGQNFNMSPVVSSSSSSSSSGALLTNPWPSSTITTSTKTFTWTSPPNATYYDLIVGTGGLGSSNLRASNVISGTSATVYGIPTNGTSVYVRLWTYSSGWAYYDYVFSTGSGSRTLSYEEQSQNVDLENQEKVFEMYPNPCSDILNVSLNGYEEVDVSIYGLEGNLVMSKTIDSDNIQMDITSLRKGIYAVVLKKDHLHLETKKISVVK